DPTTGVWTVGDFDTRTINAPLVLTVTARVNSTNVPPNTATITHANQFDPNPANNSATSPVSPQQADVSIVKMVNDPTPNAGDAAPFTTPAGNNGPTTPPTVQPTDRLPAGLTFASATASQGSYDSATGVWTVGTVDTTTQQALQIKAVVVSPQVQNNRASVTA